VNRMTFLTRKERAVLLHLMEGLCAHEIAALEYMAVSTVRAHTRQIFLKLGVNTQHGAVAYAFRATWQGDLSHREVIAAQ